MNQIGSIYIYDSVKIKWTVNGKEESNDSRFRWISENPNIASVKDGFCTGRYPGSTKLNLYLFGNGNNSKSDGLLLESMVVNVLDYDVESVRVEPETLEIYPGRWHSLWAGVLPESTTRHDLSWSTSNRDIAIPSSIGGVLGKKAGTAIIRATSVANPDAFAECVVTVKKIDTLRIVTNNKAGSHAIIGGSNPDIPATGTDFLSYSNGMVYWTENNTGRVRHQKLVIPVTGSSIEVTQVGPEALMGSWTMTSTMRSSSASNSSIGSVDITIAEPSSDGFDLGIKGLYYSAILDAVFTVDTENESLRMGLLLDECIAKRANNGKLDYPYVCFIPMCAGQIDSHDYHAGPYDMAPVPINDSDNQMLLWFVVSDDFKTMRYYKPNWQFVPGSGGASGKPVAGISCLLSSSEKPSASDFYETYSIVYCASRLTDGITFERK